MKNSEATETEHATAEEAAPTEKSKKSSKSRAVNLRELADGKSDILHIDPRKIQVKDGFNARRDFGDMHELRESIRANGVRTPLRIFTENGVVYVESGHRRLKAVQDLINQGVDIKTVPCIPEPKGTTEEQRTLGLVLDNDGMRLKPIEEAYVFDRLSNYGWSDKDIAEKTGRSQAHISNARQLLKTPKEVQKLVLDDKISSSFVLETQRALVSKAKEKSENGEIDLTKIQDQLKEKMLKVVEKATALGKKRGTKKIANEGTTRKTSRKKEKNELLELIKETVDLLQQLPDKFSKRAEETIERWHLHAASILGTEVVSASDE